MVSVVYAGKTKEPSLCLLAVALLISCLYIPASAANPDSPYTFDGTDMGWVLCDEEGNIVQQSNPVSRVTYNYNVDIPNGYNYTQVALWNNYERNCDDL